VQRTLETMSQWQGISHMLMPAALASGVLLCAAGILAAMVSDTFGKAIVDRYGATVALFTDTIVAPRVQELARHSTLSDRKKEELDGLVLARCYRSADHRLSHLDRRSNHLQQQPRDDWPALGKEACRPN
jgi:hypothetical protein